MVAEQSSGSGMSGFLKYCLSASSTHAEQIWLSPNYQAEIIVSEPMVFYVKQVCYLLEEFTGLP